MSTTFVMAVLVLAMVVVILTYVGRSNRRRQRAVLPSHYNVERYVGATESDVWCCRECGSYNDPEGEFCKNCIAPL